VNLPTIIIGILVAAVFIAVAARCVYNWKQGKGGCSCGCGGCPHSGFCHPGKKAGNK